MTSVYTAVVSYVAPQHNSVSSSSVFFFLRDIGKHPPACLVENKTKHILYMCVNMILLVYLLIVPKKKSDVMYGPVKRWIVDSGG